MKIFSVFDKEFAPYGMVFENAPVDGLLAALEKVALPETGIFYTAHNPAVADTPQAKALAPILFGGLPVQFGHCCGRNSKLNCLEYHRDSEFNLSAQELVVLLAARGDIVDGKLDTSKVKAFRVPAGTLIETFASTLHYAPCQTGEQSGFRWLVALPMGTNCNLPERTLDIGDNALMWRANNWLLAHPDSAEASRGAVVCITGENIDVASL